MDCQDVRPQLLDYQRGRLAPVLQADIRAHLANCAACARAEGAEQTLTELLERGLPQYPASLALKRRLAAEWLAPFAARRSWWSRWSRPLVPALAVAVVLLVAMPLYYELVTVPHADGTASLVTEAVNDHLRVLFSQHPLDIESGAKHQVKPWFTGRLDFAPEVSIPDDPGFPLRGGAVGYFRDRKAAVFVFARRLHTISLLVFHAEGLPWPARGLKTMGRVRAYATVARGFNVVLWREGELGYALVSDLDASELLQLAVKLSGGSS